MAEKRKEVDALEVLLKAAITRRDGAVRRGRRAAAETAEETSPGELTESQTDLRARIVDALESGKPVRIDHLAEELSVEKSQLVEIMQNDEAFERRGPAYWALASE
ncbi:MAG: hypothetical protein JNK76_25850 [Planctomycetales bacterium]|nr:hypothetical protein [Planctomycetales bacterium]